MKVVIVKYNAGNICSVENALERLGISSELSDNHETLRSADRIIFPGVGSANAAMASLREKSLDKLIPTLTQPVLGVCVGMQLMCAHSEEGDTDCLKIFPQRVKKFDGNNALKVPQVGWNTITDLKTPLFNNIGDHEYIYNVHSYYVELSDHAIATCNYGINYAAAINKDNFYGVQFHTEKSSAVGDRILQNFLAL